ncbi:MAG: hypothetical protein JXJ20_14365 [Anaerolineae bacterium]|jgi:hypothetical protein|nr:hypothetical protein [Anaerolineae bacterium]
MITKRPVIVTLIGLIVLIMLPVPAHAQGDSWLMEQINALRAGVGVAPYALNAQLSAAAYQQSAYLAATCDISHTHPDGSTAADRAAANGYTGRLVNENIYCGNNPHPADAFDFWVNSPPHYNGLTNNIDNELGIGYASGMCGHCFTLVFGYRQDVTAPPAPEAAIEVPADDLAAPPPTSAPYVPPPPSSTPTPTIPTLTPSPTWTITPTEKPSPTGTMRPPTGTPLVLPTVPVPGQVAAVADVPSPTRDASPASPPTWTSVPPSPVPVEADRAGIVQANDGFTIRDLIPFALAGQVVLIGLAGFVYFRRAR